MVRPTSISADRQRAILSVSWNDGRRTHYPMAALSAACPCAQCNDERQKLAEAGLDPVVHYKPKSSYLEHIEPVGSYAINIVWKDGCRYGIYTWDFLLGLDALHPEWREQP